MTFGARRDSNHAAVRDALRQAGAYVIDMASLPGAGFDLLALFRGSAYFVEVKPGGRRDDLTANEITTRLAIRSHGGKYVVCCSVNEVLREIGALA